jgi:hypothetical protein
MKDAIDRCLPQDLLRRASLGGNEYAWRLDDIPTVIEAARAAGLVNRGGQLQFRIPGSTCDAHWVSVYPYRSMSKRLAWDELVECTAVETRARFYDLYLEHDFLAEIRQGFGEIVDGYRAAGHDPEAAICFVWNADGRWESRHECL